MYQREGGTSTKSSKSGFGHIFTGVVTDIKKKAKSAGKTTGNAIRRQQAASSGGGGGGYSGGGGSSLDQLYASLYGGGLESQASKAASEIYGPQLGYLQGLIPQTKREAGASRKSLGELFGALSRSISGDIPGIQNMFGAAQRGTAAAYAGANKGIGNIYDSLEKEQMDLFNRLNIQAAAPDVLGPQGQDEAFLKGLNTSEAATQRSYLELLKQGDIGFTRAGAQMARTEGANRQADITSQLGDILSGYRGRISDVKSKQAATKYDILNQLKQQVIAQQAAAQRAQEAAARASQHAAEQRFSQDLALAKFKQSQEKFAWSKTHSGSAANPVYSGQRGFEQVFMERMGSQARDLPAIRNVKGFAATQMAKELSQSSNIYGSKPDPYTIASRVASAGVRAGFTSKESEIMRDAVLASLGRY
jgi:hypothetical protein